MERRVESLSDPTRNTILSDWLPMSVIPVLTDSGPIHLPFNYHIDPIRKVPQGAVPFIMLVGIYLLVHLMRPFGRPPNPPLRHLLSLRDTATEEQYQSCHGWPFVRDGFVFLTNRRFHQVVHPA